MFRNNILIRLDETMHFPKSYKRQADCSNWSTLFLLLDREDKSPINEIEMSNWVMWEPIVDLDVS